MYQLIIGNAASPLATFSDADMRDINYTQSVDVVGAQLTIDTLTPIVDREQGEGASLVIATLDYDAIESSDDYLMASDESRFDLRLAPYGTPVILKRNGNLLVKAYVKNVLRQGTTTYRINAMSAIGLLDNQQHNGGIYNGVTFAALLADIVGGIVPYTVDDDVGSTTIYGWLPRATKRENLHQLLFANGVMIGRNADGDMHFQFLPNSEAKVVPDNRVYIGGEVDYSALATEVRVTEHTFIAQADDEVVTELDNSDGDDPANNTLIIFRNAPLHDLAVTGTLTISESNPNYAVVTGVGTLTGKKYTHTEKIVSVLADDAADRESNIVTSDGCTLVSLLNSENVAARLLAHYSSKKTVASSIVLEDEKPGDLLSLSDPYSEEVVGYLSQINATASGIIKANCRIVTNYQPTGGNNYTDALVFDEDATIDLADILAQYPDKENDVVQLILIGGGQGGRKGNNNGGAGGLGGQGGKVLTATVHVNTLASTSFALTVGEGGESNQDGTDTVFGDWTSADGVVKRFGWANIFTSEVYATQGERGVAGGGSGQSVTYKGQTWRGGGSAAYSFEYSDTYYQPPQRIDLVYHGSNGRGGGAAVGQNGSSCASSSAANDDKGKGGHGGNANAGDNATVYGAGGNGGHGGGAGGAGGALTIDYTITDWITGEVTTGTEHTYRDAGGDGTGGAGGRGGDGCLIIMV